jgi:hypothetical protein
MSSMQLTDVEAGASGRFPGLWTWASPDAPIRISVDLGTVSGLRKELQQYGSRGEAGGVLLGRADTSNSTVEVHGYVFLPPAEESAGDYHLDVAQLERLKRKHRDLPVVGYFRTQAEGALHLRRAELNLVAAHFSEPTDVVLLIRTANHNDFKAGFLFWDRGSFVPFSVQDFPLDAGALAGDETAAPRISFAPIDESPAPEFRAPVENPFAAPYDPPIRFAPRPVRKSPVTRRNTIAAGALVGGLAALSLFLFRNHLPWSSQPTSAQEATSSTLTKKQTENVTPPPVPVKTEPAATKAVPRTPAPAASTPPRVAATPARSAPPAPAPVKLPPATSRASAAAAPVLNRPAPAKQVPPPQQTASVRTANVQQSVPLAPPPDVSVREQPPAPTNTPVQVPVPAVVAPPQRVEAAAPKANPPVVTPKPAPVPSRFAGAWSYPMTNGLYHGSQPEVVEVVIQEANGRLSGTAYARFKPSPSEPSRTLRFQFGGEVRPGRTQSFTLETVDGAKGSVELIPGTSPSLVELNFRTAPESGNGQTGNMILVKR